MKKLMNFLVMCALSCTLYAENLQRFDLNEFLCFKRHVGVDLFSKSKLVFEKESKNSNFAQPKLKSIEELRKVHTEIANTSMPITHLSDDAKQSYMIDQVVPTGLIAGCGLFGRYVLSGYNFLQFASVGAGTLGALWYLKRKLNQLNTIEQEINDTKQNLERIKNTWDQEFPTLNNKPNTATLLYWNIRADKDHNWITKGKKEGSLWNFSITGKEIDPYQKKFEQQQMEFFTQNSARALMTSGAQ